MIKKIIMWICKIRTMKAMVKLIFLFTICCVLPLSTTAQRIYRSEKGLYGIGVIKSNGNVKWLAKPNYTVIEKKITALSLPATNTAGGA